MNWTHSEKKMQTLLKFDKSMTKLASEWVDNRPFAPREIENNANAKFWRENKQYYGILKKIYCRVNYHKLAPE